MKVHSQDKAMAEKTILDGPETPAPLFAYRALKGILFGSPDNHDDDHDKENASALPRYTGHEEKLISPLVSLSSKRRGLQISSPAKSILRAPGIPTPRKRAGISVSFKDVRKSESTSPEIKMKVKPAARATKKDDKQAKGAVSRKADPTSESVSNTPTVLFAQQPVQHMFSTTDFDIDAYMHATEKEMKKLVQYSQRMREYARKQDKDNAELRKMVEELKRENQMLSKNELERRRVTRLTTSHVNPTQTEQPKKILSVPKNTVKAVKDKAKPAATVENSNGESLGTKRSLELDATSAAQPSRVNIQLSNDEVRFGDRRSSAHFPPDRLAAARERVRVKAEQRKASENTQVDWANL